MIPRIFTMKSEVHACIECPAVDVRLRGCRDRTTKKVHRRFDAGFEPAQEIPDWCPLPSAEHSSGGKS